MMDTRILLPSEGERIAGNFFHRKKFPAVILRKRGFTLLESLVAIAILLIAVVAPMSIIGGSLSQISMARDWMTAVNLAQEGVEAVRQQRDSNMLDAWGGGSSSWDTGLSVNSYIVDLTAADPLIICPSCTNAQQTIRQDATTGLYYQAISGSGGTATKFSRYIFIDDNFGAPEKVITSRIRWSVGGAIKQVEVRESIFGIDS